jgi:hypothetical protein
MSAGESKKSGDLQPDAADKIQGREASGKALDEVPAAVELLEDAYQIHLWLKFTAYLFVSQLLL